jgi:hypothetical protein
MTTPGEGSRPASGAHLVQLLLPLERSDGARFAADLYRDVTRELTERFGGVQPRTRERALGGASRPDRT